MDTLKETLWGEPSSSEVPSPVDAVGSATANDSLCTSLSYKKRIIGFVVCTVLGVLLSLGGTFFLFTSNFTGFGIMYSLGNIIAISATMFLMGPVKQIKEMFKKTRVIATVVFLVALVLTLVLAFTVHIPVLILVCVIIQALAFAWYGLSYIPFAREAVKKFAKSIFPCC
uniref:Vesicle transport protein n=1 Tax=Arcella intermedia TaxID=1963864 RepID=A0A6B2LMW9_9EUKA|eukprot:TRINITY_DN23515_c0_g1_i1.p1 TRINITY_DN23515_c0_g1~~TRINITY_DN23515_c0_g1_i1.p1  ORF type:complete len:170 (-),score=31.65 TRINITY_DN23515_c0_g1_i1:136-645(-)